MQPLFADHLEKQGTAAPQGMQAIPTRMGVSRLAAYASTVRSVPLKAYTVRTLASACCAIELASVKAEAGTGS